MKNFLKIFSILATAGLLVFSCTKDEIDVEALTDFAPGIVSITPSNNSKIVVGDFDLKVIVADGQSSPLSEISVELTDEFGNTLAEATQGLSGTRDSIVVPGADFAVPANQLGAGVYSINITVADTKGQTANRSTSFEISLLPFAANHDVMWIAGAFNGWGADEMTLVADHTWEISGIDLLGEAWKFKNCFDWCDEDWGDADCNGFMESNLDGGNGDTACGYSGEVTVTFNDETLEYTVRPAVEFATNLSGLYLLGTFNNFDSDEYRFQLIADNTWELPEILLSEGDEFKFAEMPNFMGKNFGDADGDGIAEEFGSNTTFSGDPGFYKVTFNDETFEYALEFIRSLVPQELYLVGALAAHGAWDAGGSIPFNKVDDNVFEIYAPLEAGQGFKFLETQEGFQNDWGFDPDNDGFIIQEGEQDATVEEDGFYLVQIDFSDNSITFTNTEWAIIGDATPGGWDADTPMEKTGDFEWSTTADLTAGEMKFRANNNWDLNFGDNEPIDGILDFGGIGNDIPVSAAGNYTITFTLHPVDGYTYSITEN